MKWLSPALHRAGQTALSGGNMHFSGRRNHIVISFLVYILLWGMCFGNIQTDSSFVCTDISVSAEEKSCSVSVLQPAGKTTPLAQAYEQEAFGQVDNALVLRHNMRRTNSRNGRSSSFDCILLLIFSTFLFHFPPTRALEDFQEVISNTVIIDYIHRKDGQKS